MVKKLLPVLFLFSCGQPEEVYTEPEVQRDTTPKPTEQQITQTDKDRIPIYHVTFGIYCGECSGHCATMYKYNRCGGNINTLWADYTDSFWNGKGDSLVCETNLAEDKASWKAAEFITQHIPERLLKSKKKSVRFGCPDCTDGCGIYLEIWTGLGGRKKFYIDYQTSQLDGEIKEFAELLKSEISKMKGPPS